MPSETPIAKSIDDVLDTTLTLMNVTGLNPLKPSLVKNLLIMSVYSFGGSLIVYAVFQQKCTYDNITLSLLALIGLLKIVLTVLTLIAKREKLKALLEETKTFWSDTKIIYDNEIDTALKRHKRFMFAYLTLVMLLVVADVPEVLRGVPSYNYYVIDYFIVHPVAFQAFQLTYLIAILLVASGFDFLFGSVVLLLGLDFKLTARRISSIHFEEEPETVHEALKESIALHQALVRRVFKINEIFGPMLLIHLYTIGALICLFAFGFITNSDAENVQELVLKGASHTTYVLLVMLAFYFLPAQYMLDQQAEIPISIYNSDWFNCADKSVRTTLTTFFMLSNRTFRILAGNFSRLDLETCTVAFKAIMTYFNYLENMKK